MDMFSLPVASTQLASPRLKGWGVPLTTDIPDHVGGVNNGLDTRTTKTIYSITRCLHLGTQLQRNVSSTIEGIRGGRKHISINDVLLQIRMVLVVYTPIEEASSPTSARAALAESTAKSTGETSLRDPPNLPKGVLFPFTKYTFWPRAG